MNAPAPEPGPPAPHPQSPEGEPGATHAPAPEAPHPGARRTGGPRRRWRWGWVGLGLVVLAVIGGLLYYWVFMRPYESTDDAFIDANVAPIAPQVAGLVMKLLVQDNEHVKPGEVLVEIDPRDYEARLEQAKAGLAASQTRLEQARAQLTLDQARVTQAQANLVSAETQSQRAEADRKRYESLQGPAVSRSQLDLAVAQARSNAAAVKVAQSQVKAAEAQVALSQAAIQTAEADIQGSQAAVRQAQLFLSYTEVTAPVEGYVSHRTVAAGAYVQTGQDLMALVPVRVWVTANFKETQLTSMRPGQPVTIHVDAYPGHEFHGHVDGIQRGTGAQFSLLPPENATGNYVKVVQRVPVKIVFDEEPNPAQPLGPGMSVVPTVNVLAQGSDAGHSEAGK